MRRIQVTEDDKQDRRRAEDRVWDLILKEISDIKKDVKDGFDGMKTEFFNRKEGCDNKFLSKDIFWKFVTILTILILGSYSYTTIIYNIVTSTSKAVK